MRSCLCGQPPAKIARTVRTEPIISSFSALIYRKFPRGASGDPSRASSNFGCSALIDAFTPQMVVGVTLTEEKLLSRNVPALYPLGTRYTGTTPLIMQIKKHLCLHQEMFLRKCCGAGGEDVKDDMIKRYIGHAVRQIMESSGITLISRMCGSPVASCSKLLVVIDRTPKEPSWLFRLNPSKRPNSDCEAT